MHNSQSQLSEIAQLFLRLGFTAFGGPAAHIAMFRDETVDRRKWLTDQEFLDLLGVTNLIPGPNSTEMAIHLGYLRGGWRGLILAGLCFILPAVFIVLALAWLYVEYGTTPAGESLLYGIKPVIIVVVLQALIALAPKAAKTNLLIAIGIAAFALYLLGINELVVMFGFGIAYMLIQNFQRIQQTAALFLLAIPVTTTADSTVKAESYSIEQLFLVFLKIGSVLYGSGYVLLAFLQGDLVDRLGWLTQQQLLDAVAVGQFTPGPVFTTATFIGYVVGGVPGAIAATIGIFLPSFIFVVLSHPLIPHLRKSHWFGALLDGVNAAALGLMAGILVQLGQTAVIDVFTVLLVIGAAVALLYYKVNTTWVIIAGGLLGLIYQMVV